MAFEFCMTAKCQWRSVKVKTLTWYICILPPRSHSNQSDPECVALQDAGDLQPVRIKILVQVRKVIEEIVVFGKFSIAQYLVLHARGLRQLDANNKVLTARMEASAEFDLFFHYHHTSSEAGMNTIVKQKHIDTRYSDQSSAFVTVQGSKSCRANRS